MLSISCRNTRIRMHVLVYRRHYMSLVSRNLEQWAIETKYYK